MATTPTHEECARHILRIFEQHNCDAGKMLMLNSFVGAGIHDLESGLKYALQHGWIEAGKNDSIFLTEEGFKEM